MALVDRAGTLIIGAGPAGLSLAYHLHNGGTLVLEKEERVGGLCRSFNIQGGVFDIGGHSFHTPFPEVKELVTSLMQGEMDEFQRDARVFTDGTLIPYPFQKYFDQIPNPEVVEACQAGLRNTRPNAPAQNYEEFIHQKFGDGIAEHFMLPYNRKLWGPDLKRLSADWTSERVAGPKNETEQFRTTGGKRTPLQANTRISYPSRGGFDEIYKRIAECLPAVECGKTIVRIDPEDRIVETAQGQFYEWERLVSTMPLPELVRIIDGTPARLIQLAGELECLPLHVELILVDHPMPNAPQRVYVANPDIPAHKIAFNHTSSRFLMEQPRHAIMGEVSLAKGKSIQVETIGAAMVDALIEMGQIKTPAEVIWQGSIQVNYGYPVYTYARPMIIEEIARYLRSLNIYTLGRFGEWEYINSDHCVWKGMELARRLEAESE